MLFREHLLQLLRNFLIFEIQGRTKHDQVEGLNISVLPHAPQDFLRQKARSCARDECESKKHGRIVKDVERAEPEGGCKKLSHVVRERARDAEQRERHARGGAQYGFRGIAPSYLALRFRRHVIPYTWHALRIAENRLAPDDFALHCSASNTVLWRKYTVGVCKC